MRNPTVTSTAAPRSILLPAANEKIELPVCTRHASRSSGWCVVSQQYVLRSAVVCTKLGEEENHHYTAVCQAIEGGSFTIWDDAKEKPVDRRCLGLRIAFMERVDTEASVPRGLSAVNRRGSVSMQSFYHGLSVMGSLRCALMGAPFGNEGILGKPYEAKSDGALIHHLRQGDDGVATHVYVLRYTPTCQPACSLGHMPTC